MWEVLSVGSKLTNTYFSEVIVLFLYYIITRVQWAFTNSTQQSGEKKHIYFL